MTRRRRPLMGAKGLNRLAALLVLGELVLLDPTLGLCVGPLDVRVEVVPADAVVAAAADLGRTELTAADEGICLGRADVELLGDLLAGDESGRGFLIGRGLIRTRPMPRSELDLGHRRLCSPASRSLPISRIMVVGPAGSGREADIAMDLLSYFSGELTGKALKTPRQSLCRDVLDRRRAHGIRHDPSMTPSASGNSVSPRARGSVPNVSAPTARVRAVIAAAVITAVTTGCGSGAVDTTPGKERPRQKDAPREMVGTVAAPECGGKYGLVHSRVTLRDQAKKIIGSATTSGNAVDPVRHPCVVRFEIADVPKAQLYFLRVGTHKGPMWSARKLRAMKFKPQLEFGGARIPTANKSTFCTASREMSTVFDDDDLLNADPQGWNSRLVTFVDTLKAVAAGLLLKDEKDQDLVARWALKVATALPNVDPSHGARALNKAIRPVNKNMTLMTTTTGFNCKKWWVEVYYTMD